MTKIMLVEDDKSLREIYGVRLLAEGYDIVSAGDGEEALAMAIKERPQLIVSDVMMPKVSGYDMLDILRSTTETKNIRVIMMTALSSEEQRMRAESLGADRYLVKSQVGIEDVVRVVHEVLEDTPATAAAPGQPSEPTKPAASPQPTTPQHTGGVSTPTQPVKTATPSVTSSAPAQPLPTPLATPTTTTGVSPAIKPQSSTPKPASLKTRVIQPLNDPTIAPVNINDLLDKELAKEAGLSGSAIPVESIDQEKADVNEQLKSFAPPEPTPVEVPSGAPLAPPTPAGPTLLPTPGVGNTSPAVPPVPAPSTPPVPSMPTTNPAPMPTPPTPPAPSTPVATPPATTTVPVQTPSTPVAEQPSPTPSAPSSDSSSNEVVDLTKLPEVPKVTDTPSV